MSRVLPSPDWALEKLAASALFDVGFYLAKYPDVAAAGLDSFEHYCAYGWHEGRDPSPNFSTRFYLQAYPDVAAAKMNPLAHYAIAGAREGRAPLRRRAAEGGKDVVLGALPARVRGRDWLPVADIDSPLAADRLQQVFHSAFLTSTDAVVVSVSHDQYAKSVGGVQTSIAIEEALLRGAGWTYIHLCPARPLPHLADPRPADSTCLILTLNGKREGVVRLCDLLAVLPRAASEAGKSMRLVVHHLMGFAVETVAGLARICNGGTPIVWVHDFFSLCTNPFLLRNDISFCHAPAEKSNACMVCAEGEGRATHLDAMRRFFDELRPIVAAPSETALNFWRAKGAFAHAKAVVLPLAVAEMGQLDAAVLSRPLRVAHLGAAAAHKGWATFRELVERHADDERYEFFRLGYGSSELRGLKEIRVEVGPANVDAMIEAANTHQIDVVINWSSCFETFSFITLEALVAGAFVVARRDAGNVWPAVAAAGRSRGIAVSTEVELRALFVTGEIIGLASARLTRGELHRSRGTADLLLKEDSLV